MQMSFCYECTCNYFRIYAICGLGCLTFLKSFKKKRQRFATCGLAEVCMSCHRNHSSIRFSGRDKKLRSRYIYIYIATSGLDLNTWQELYLIFISFGSLAVRFKYLRKPITYHNLAVSIMSSGGEI